MHSFVPFAEALEDYRVNTHEEVSRSYNFVLNGEFSGTRKSSKRELQSLLDDIGYKKEDHKSYTFFLHKPRDPNYGCDFRHIYIKELDKYFSYI